MILSYLKLQEEYGQKYGQENTIVLYQVGSFYECYFYDYEKDENKPTWPTKKIGNAIEVGALLNMVVTKRDKNKPYGLNNCNLVGFPIVAYEKHKQVLLNNGYTIIRMDQKKDGKEIERVVGEIVSACTNIENLSSLPISNNIVCVFIEVLKESYNFEDYSIAVGISSIDVTTGQNKVFEVYSKECDHICALQEIYRFLSSYLPIEVLFHLTFKSSTLVSNIKIAEYEKFLVTNLDLSKYVMFTNNMNADFLKIDYATRFLSKIFIDSNSILVNPNIIEELGLERSPYAMTSYLLLLQYCYEHNPTLIEKLNKPEICNNDKYLVLTHNAISQIDLLPNKTTNSLKNKTSHSSSSHRMNRKNKNIDSLFSVINYTKTSLGKRYLLNFLTHPITDVSVLETNYTMIDDLINNPTLISSLRDILKDIPDMERYQRKLYLKLIKPNEFSILFQAYISIISIYTKILESNNSLVSLLFHATEFNKCLSLVLSKIKLEIFASCKIESGKDGCNGKIISDEKIFYDGSDSKMDSYWMKLENIKKNIHNILIELNSHLSSTKGKKIEYEESSSDKNEKNENSYGFWTTPHKASILLKSDINTKICGEIKVINFNKDVMVTSDIISCLLSSYSETKEELSKYLYSCYMSMLSIISTKFNFFPLINGFVSKVDYICSGAKAAIENKYFRPTIKETSEHKSYCEIVDLRHPVVEAVISGEYVPNNVYLGNTSQGINSQGILLYGENSAGKSTLVKAVALNIILAQCGLFTAGKITFYPYTKLITRLSGNDNILHNESSFVVEMKELRTILRNADPFSLILGDEIARGTESISAASISISALTYLVEKKSCFIFTSHLHNIVGTKEIVALGNQLQIAHLSLQYVPETNMIIYERKLKDGPGESIYGLEIANSLGLNSDFIRKAYEIRNELVKKSLFMSDKKSNYNSRVYVDRCFICGTNELDKLNSHHIKEQKKADENGFIGVVHKNIPDNLIELCSECHSRLHVNGLSIVSQETSKGLSLKIIS